MTILITGLTNKKVNQKKGFTLLELLLVMIIIAIVMGITAPSLGLFSGSRHIINASANFVALTDYARSQSISEGRIYKLNIEKDKNVFWLTARSNGSFEKINKEIGRNFILPEGVEIESLEIMYNYQETEVPGLRMPGQWYVEDEPENQGEESIIFSPDGFIQPATLRMRDKKGNQLEIKCSSPSDRFYVVSMERDGI